MMILADFFKALYTIKLETLIKEMIHLASQKLSQVDLEPYSTSKTKLFVDTDGDSSDQIEVAFGAPLGSILGPVLLNFFVADLQSDIKMS